MTQVSYPWFGSLTGDDLEQGDILAECPVFRPPEGLSGDDGSSAFFEAEARDVIVMSQSCDLIQGREKLSEVLLCPIWGISTFKPSHHLSTAKGREAARRGELPSIHLLATCDLTGLEREVSAVDFRQVYLLTFHRSAERGITMYGFRRQRIAVAATLLALAVTACNRNKSLTRANYDKISAGMTLAEVQSLLGGPGEQEGGDLALAEGSGGAGAVGIGGDLQSMSQPRSKVKTYKWGTDSRYIKVVFNGDKVAADNFKSEQGLK